MTKSENAHLVIKDKLIEYSNYLIDNIYMPVGDHIYRQVLEAPMGIGCAPFLANLYSYALEFIYMDEIYT